VPLQGWPGRASHTLRFTPPQTRRTVLLYARGADGWKNIHYTEDGSALVFSMEGETMTLCVVESMRHWLAAACTGIAAVLLLLLFLLVRRRRRQMGKGMIPVELVKKIKNRQAKKTVSG